MPKTLTGEELQLDDGPVKGAELFLVDGNNLAYRAFFALPEELQTTDGQPTNALLGFTNMLFKLLSDYGPRGVAVAWDTRPTHRTEIAETYKEGRRPMPDLLREQFPHFRPIVEAFGYSNLEFEGWEADDVIATLATRADEAGIRTCVVSTDRDAFQLCSENVSLMMTPRGVADVHVYTPERVELRYGVRPDQVPDFIGLKGDTSDNIPGIPGIGDKTAGQLIAQYGSLEEVIAHAADLSPARSKAVVEHADQARASKVLATMQRDLPLDVDVGALVASPPDRSTLKEIFRRFEFRGLLSRVDTLDAALPAAEPVEADQGRTCPGARGSLEPHVAGRSASWRPTAGLPSPTAQDVVVATPLPVEVGARRRLGRDRDARREGAAPRSRSRRHDDRGLPRRPGSRRLRVDDLAREYGLELVPEPMTEEETAALVRRAEAARRLAPIAPRAPAGVGDGAALRRDRAAAHRASSRTWRTPASGSTRTGWARSRPASRSASRSSRRARSSWPARSSSSARPSSSPGSCSRSSHSPRGGRGRPATRPTPASFARSATTTRSSPSSRSGAS